MREKSTSQFVKSTAKKAYSGWKGRKFYVEVSDRSQQLFSYWDGGSKDTFVVVNLKNGSVGYPPTNVPFQDSVERYQPQAGYALAMHRTSCGKDGGVTIYLHPDDAHLVD